MLHPVPIPGLIVTGTDTGVGKTLIAAAIADWFYRKNHKVAVCKPCGSGCVKRREGLVSEDAEFLAHCAHARHPLDLICPERYKEPLAPAIAAQISKRPLDWENIDRAIQLMSADSDVMIVEGVGGLLVPMDNTQTFADVITWLKLPVVIVARAGLGTINHTLLTLEALRNRKAKIAGVVINRYHGDQTPLAEETNPAAIEKYGKIPVLCLVPEEKVNTIGSALAPPLPKGVMSAIDQVMWSKFTRPRKTKAEAD